VSGGELLDDVGAEVVRQRLDRRPPQLRGELLEDVGA
jgi:hypothetical protein